jgi:tetratricopeptide (TPR) repeat protein
MQPLNIKISIADFDCSLINISACNDQPDKIRERIADYFADELKSFGGDLKITVTQKEISIKWTPVSKEEPEKLIDYAISLLQQGNIDNAEPILKELLKQSPDNFNICYNYGMVLSDKNDLKNAINLLGKAVKTNPTSADSWNALGVAYQRNKDQESAKKCLEKSYEINPDNPFTQRNLGAIIANTDPKEALIYLEKAANRLPNDMQAQYGYALCLFKAGNIDKADTILQKTIKIAPHSQIAELCRQLRTKIAEKSLRKVTGESQRPDVVMYCLAALKKFKEVGADIRQTIVFEIAMLGRSGLDINDPTQKYTLKSLPGKHSGLQLSCYMYTGFQQIDPSLDVGIDYSKEYNEALKIHNSGVV